MRDSITAIAPAARPIIGSTAQVGMSNIPSALAFLAVGFSSAVVGPFALPLPLGGYGMPGCYLLQSAENAAFPVAYSGSSTATFSLQLPNWFGLIGLQLYLQGWAVAPGVNPGYTIVSNGVEWAIGNS